MQKLKAWITALFSSGCTNPAGGGGTNYTVSFAVNGGTPAPEAKTVSSGGTIAEPTAPDKTGYILAGWYREAGFANPGREGHNGTDGAAPGTTKTEPVTYINWRDALDKRTLCVHLCGE